MTFTSRLLHGLVSIPGKKERKPGFEVFYSFTGFSLPLTVEREI